MSFDPSIPAANDVLSQSQSDIQNNFSQSNTLQGLDHYNWNDSTAAGAYRGFHKKLTFPEAPTSDPAIGANKGIFYTKADTKDANQYAQVFWQNQNRKYQITNGFYSQGTSGYYMFPLGRNTVPPLIMMWGKVAITAANPYPVTFPTMTDYTPVTAGFPTAIFNIQLTIQCDSASNYRVSVDQTVAPSTTGFTLDVSGSTSTGNVYWIAWGN